MTPEGIPDKYREMLDRAAGREHSATGSVMTCLAEILTAFQNDLLEDIWQIGMPAEVVIDPHAWSVREPPLRMWRCECRSAVIAAQSVLCIQCGDLEPEELKEH